MKKLILLWSIVMALALVGCNEKAPAQPAAPVAPPIDQLTPQPGGTAPLPPENADISPAELPLTNVGDTADVPQSAYTPVVPIEAPVEENEMDRIRAAAKEQGCPLAVAYLGFDFDVLADELDVAAIMAAYPCTADTAYIDAGGDEAYLLIPTDPNASVWIDRLVLTDDGQLLPTGGTLYAGGSAPIILRCNVSDIMPNVIVRVESDNGQAEESSPTISLRDGSVSMPGAYDFTKYPEGFERES